MDPVTLGPNQYQRNRVPLPRSWDDEAGEGGFLIRGHAWRPGAVGNFALAVALNLGLLALVRLGLQPGNPEFLLLPLLGWFPAWAALFLSFGILLLEWEFRADADTFSLDVHPRWSLVRPFSCRRDELMQLFCLRHTLPFARPVFLQALLGNREFYSLIALLKDGRTQVLLSSLKENEALALEQALETRLGIQDRVVAGSWGGSRG